MNFEVLGLKFEVSKIRDLKTSDRNRDGNTGYGDGDGVCICNGGWQPSGGWQASGGWWRRKWWRMIMMWTGNKRG
jgi:hypothetical protein